MSPGKQPDDGWHKEQDELDAKRQQEGHWVTHSRELIYENPWLRLSHREVTAPTGAAGIYGVVHLRTLAVGIVPIDAEGCTWLIGQYRYATACYSWEIPMGGCPEGEDPEATAHRELAEEAGLRAERMEDLLELQISNCVSDERARVFVAHGLSPCEAQPDATESLQSWRLPLDEAISMAMRGEVTDAVSVAALLKLAYRGKA